jgi:beta-glucosidase
MSSKRSYFRKAAAAGCLAMWALICGTPITGGRAEAQVIPPRGSNSEERQINALIEQMTIEEKLGQLTLNWGGGADAGNPDVKNQKEEELLGQIRAGTLGAVLGAQGAEYVNRLQAAAAKESRLKIPLLVGNDVIHGYYTIFPIPLAESCSWDGELVGKSARTAASEARAAGTNWTFAPMVDICRDARWGRAAEGAGEDPFLGSVMAAARVRGFQSESMAAPDSVAACVKHYVAYGAAEGGRDYNLADISEQTLREVYLPPFKAAVDEGAASAMSAFNEINGVPATANPFTLKHVLREEWGFDGFVVSDWTSVTEMVAHGFAADAADAARKALLAGVDMDMSSSSYRTHLADAVKQGLVPMKAVDTAVRNVLRIKIRLGLFDNPYSEPSLEKKLLLCPEHRAIARDMARNSIVLLKNEKNTLPLLEDVGAIAVIGPLADNKHDPLGTWAVIGKPPSAVPILENSVVTVLEGLKRRLPSTPIAYTKGCEVLGESRDGFAEAVELAKKSDVCILVLGESEDMSGEAHSRSSLGLPGVQLDLLKAVHATGKPTILVLMNGRPLTIPWEAENIPAIVEAWHLGCECGNAVADILLGDFNPSGKLVMTFPRTVGQVPIYYNHKNTGRPPTEERYTSKYIDVPWEPLYPFGHGLSYTHFKYANLKVSPERTGAYGWVRVSAEVRNVGKRGGYEVAQLYIRDLVGSLTRPVKQLRGFERIYLEPGDSKRVTFELSHDLLGFYNNHGEYIVEPGKFKVWIGPSSAEGLEGEFEVQGEEHASTAQASAP